MSKAAFSAKDEISKPCRNIRKRIVKRRRFSSSSIIDFEELNDEVKVRQCRYRSKKTPTVCLDRICYASANGSAFFQNPYSHYLGWYIARPGIGVDRTPLAPTQNYKA